MAKAATKSKAAKPAAGRARKGARPATKPWVKVLILILLFPFAALLLPTTLVFATFMAPTIIAYITDRSREKHLAVTVGMLNFAGTLPSLIELWSRGQSHPAAMDLIADVFAWVVAYGAASMGWVIFGFMPSMVGTYFRMTTQTRIMALRNRQKKLIAEWGRAVADGIATPSLTGGEDEDDEAQDPDLEEDEIEDAEVTEAELVDPLPAR